MNNNFTWGQVLIVTHSLDVRKANHVNPKP
jgi:hypothetical protein